MSQYSHLMEMDNFHISVPKSGNIYSDLEYMEHIMNTPYLVKKKVLTPNKTPSEITHVSIKTEEKIEIQYVKTYFSDNPEILSVIEALLAGRNILLHGKAGTGKSTFINKILKTPEFVDSNICATTGTAAVLLDCGATTLHSWAFKDLGDNSIDHYVLAIQKNPIWQLAWRSKLLIIDEVSMLKIETLDKIEKIARNIRQNEKPFGGLQIMLSGDFLQLPPVETNRKEKHENNSFCFAHEKFSEWFQIVDLKKNYRQNTDIAFVDLLDNLRLGKCAVHHQALLSSRMKTHEDNSQVAIQPTKLFTRRVNVNYINTAKLEELTSELHVYNHSYTITRDQEVVSESNLRPEEISSALKSFDFNSQHEQVLKIRVGAQVMLIKNLDLSIGLCNGSRGVVVDFIDYPVVEFTNGSRRIIKPELWKVKKIRGLWLQRSQVPLKLAWALTIHKSQGMTLDKAIIDLSDSFEYGQSYVALSRVKNLEGLYLSGLEISKIKAHPFVLKWLKSLGL